MNHDRYYIGGANIAGILGVSPYSSPVLEYLKIRGEAPPPTAEELRFFGQRKRREPYIVESLEIDHGLQLPVRNQRYTDPELDYLKAEIDGENPGAYNAELKTVHPRAKDAASWTSRAEDPVPLHVVAQAQWGLMLRPAPMAFAVGEVGYETFPYPIQPDLELQGEMRARAVEFWERYVLKGEAPEPASDADVAALYPRSKPATIVHATAEIFQLVQDLARTKRDLKALELREVDQLTTLKAFMGEADTLMGGADSATGGALALLVTWKSNRPSLVCDWQALARATISREQLATICPKFTQQRDGNRPLLVKYKLPELVSMTGPAS